LCYLEHDLLSHWSLARDGDQPNNKSFADCRPKSLKLWTKAYQWASTSIKLLSDPCIENVTSNYVSASGHLADGKPVPITQETINNWKRAHLSWATFEEFKNWHGILWVISMDASNWENAKCNCPQFLKEDQCKHSLGLAIRLRLAQAPPEAKTIPFGQRRKRGRPARAKTALVFQ
jgi:hypothetical protein